MMIRVLLIGWMLALLLAACNSNNNTTSEGETPNPGFGELDPAGQIAQEETPAQTELDPAETGLAEPVVVNAPILASTLLVYDVGSLDGQAGETNGLVLNGVTGQLHYLLIETTGPSPSRTRLLPWGAFQVVALPPEGELEGAEPTPQVWLTVDRQALLEAPEFDPAVLADSDNLAGGWDEQHISYWSGLLPDLPVTGEPAAGEQPAADEQPAAETEEQSEEQPALIYIQDGLFMGIDFDVRNPENQSLGEIVDFVIAMDGKAEFAILEPESLLNLGSGLVPVPWTALVWEADMQMFILNLTSDTLAQAPRLDPANLPDMTLPGWEEDWRQFWQTQPAQMPVETPTGTEPSSSSAMLIGRVLDQPVVTADGEHLGSLLDWVVGLSGQSEFVVIAQDERIIPMPWQAFIWQLEEGRLIYTLDPQAASQAPSYESAVAMDEDPEWMEGAMGYWSDFAEMGEIQPTLDPDVQIEQVRASQLIDNPFAGIDGAELGTVEEIIVGQQGAVDFLVVQAGGLLRPVPWANFEYHVEDGQLLYLDDVERLADAPGFAGLDEMSTDQEGWDADIRMYWGLK